VLYLKVKSTATQAPSSLHGYAVKRIAANLKITKNQ